MWTLFTILSLSLYIPILGHLLFPASPSLLLTPPSQGYWPGSGWLVTHSPSRSSITQFWRTVVNKKCGIVIGFSPQSKVTLTTTDPLAYRSSINTINCLEILILTQLSKWEARAYYSSLSVIGRVSFHNNVKLVCVFQCLLQFCNIQLGN